PATLHAAAAHQNRDAALDAGAETLAVFERCRSLIGLALRSFMAAPLRNASRVNGALHAGCHILFAEEAAIGAIEFRDAAKGAAVALERGRHMNVVRRISLEHVILGDQTLGAFGEEQLVTELDGRAHLTALDQVGMRLEDRIKFFAV